MPDVCCAGAAWVLGLVTLWTLYVPVQGLRAVALPLSGVLS